MKVLLFLSCALAAASAGYAPSVYYGGYHVPVIGPNGVPVETAEVQAAKAHHFAAHAEANARSGHYGVYAAPSAHVYTAYPAAPIGHDGQPLDTPEVAAAKAQHFHDYAVAAQRNGVHVPQAAPLGHYPVDTPEVQLAKAQHFAAHAAARSGHYYRKRRSIFGGYHVPVIHNGVPVETPEVQAAKAHHLAAHAEAASRAGHVEYAAPIVQYGAYSHHVPVIHNGVPVDTPEVQAAKANHFAAYAAATNGVHHYAPAAWVHQPYATIGHDGQPVETPEVQLAKSAHFAAHAAARQHYY